MDFRISRIVISAVLLSGFCLFVGAQESNPMYGFVGNGKATGERIRVESEGLANPERGFRFEIKVGLEGSATENKWPFEDYKDDGIVMTQAYCYLSKY